MSLRSTKPSPSTPRDSGHGRRRLDRRLQQRVGASDVVQEAYLDASKRLAEYLANPTMPFFLWLRFLTGQKLMEMHRRHLGVKARDAAREVSIYGGSIPEATTTMLAEKLLGRFTSPSHAAMRAEMKIRLQDALNSMEPVNREVLALRHFERLDNAETAQVLGMPFTVSRSRCGENP